MQAIENYGLNIGKAKEMASGSTMKDALCIIYPDRICGFSAMATSEWCAKCSK